MDAPAATTGPYPLVVVIHGFDASAPCTFSWIGTSHPTVSLSLLPIMIPDSPDPRMMELGRKID
jgi:hypothetical protein